MSWSVIPSAHARQEARLSEVAMFLQFGQKQERFSVDDVRNQGWVNLSGYFRRFPSGMWWSFENVSVFNKDRGASNYKGL